MAQGLFLSQKMSLAQVLAPQMQQSLALLQAPTLELKAMVEQELQQNPVLEEVPVLEPEAKAEQVDDDARGLDPAEPPKELLDEPAEEKPAETTADDFQAEFDRLSRVDQDWRDQYNQGNSPLRSREDDEEKQQYLLNSMVAETSLQEVLLEQARLADLSGAQPMIAEMLIGNIDERGYLRASVDELSFATNTPAEEIATVLRIVQTFHPPGVGARDLRECLRLQLERSGRQETFEYRLVSDHLEALVRRRFPELARLCNLTIADIQVAAERIGHLEPYPGREFLPESAAYVVPEVFVKRVSGEYVVTTNQEYFPHLHISNAYKDLMAQADSSAEVRDYIRDKIRAGKFLIKSLHQRQETILRIAQEIVSRQREFLEQGRAHLKPLTMSQVAQVVGVHETTVSRAVSGKYMETPQGTFEMKFFFTSGLQTTQGVSMSNTSLKDILADLIRQENPRHPLSDEDLVKQFAERGVSLARRTVAKYRAELNLLPSNLRRIY